MASNFEAKRILESAMVLSMTRARMIIPNQAVLLTRRCTQRTFLLRPSREVNKLIRYCLAYAMEKTGIRLHAFVIMSNHFHLLVTDCYGLLPLFMQLFNRLVAVALNTLYDRSENLWASTPYSAVTLSGSEDVIDKLLYTLLNPVAAGLVRTAASWPGVTSAGISYGTVMVAERPGFYFRTDGIMPDTIRFQLSVPPALSDVHPRDLTTLVDRETKRIEAQYQAQFAKQERRFLGASHCKKTSPFASPKTESPKQSLNPRLAAKDTQTRSLALRRLRQFWEDYCEALQRWRGGDRQAVFPYGTYALRILSRVLCRGPTIPEFCGTTG